MNISKPLDSIETCPNCGYRSFWESFLIDKNFIGCPCCMSLYEEWSNIKKEKEK